MRYLITSGEGFIGRNIRSQLQQEGHDALSLDVKGSPDYNVDILDFDRLQQVFHEVDGVFHMAAVTSPPQFEDDLFTGFDVNVRGTLNVLKAASVNRVKRVVLASSSSVYGNLAIAGKEDMAIPGHENMYSTTKLFDEYLGRHFTIRKEVEVVALRFFNAYGMGENSKGMYSSIMTKFLDSIRKGEAAIVFGDGTQSRDFIFVDDLAQATIRAMENGVPGEVYNVGTGVTTTFNDIVRLIGEVIGSKVEATHVKNPFKNYQYFTQANISKAEKDLNWRPSFALKDGIRKMAMNYGLI